MVKIRVRKPKTRLHSSALNMTPVTILLEPERLALVDKYAADDISTREAIVKGSLISYLADRVLEDFAG